MEQNPSKIVNSSSQSSNQYYLDKNHSKTVAEIETWLVDKIAELLQLAPEKIDLGQPLAVYGLNSIKAVSIATELEEWLGISVVSAIVYDYPSIKALAGFLRGKTPQLNSSAFVSNSQAATDTVAIIGIGCKFPGANNYQQFWQNLEQGINSISEIPSERWEVEKYYSPTPQERNKSISKWGGFIEGIDQFDAQFFGISPREAQLMDPQQRLMLELSWSCLEDAGYAPSQLSGSSTGVFIGGCHRDYEILQHSYGKDAYGHGATGTWTFMIPNRISFLFNFRGPSVPVDTACSSSLVAIHQAIDALNAQECDTAIVGGVNLLCEPTKYIQMSQLGMLSPQGQCKTFDSKADGYVRGEGAGVILLKPLAKAIEDRDHIYGVISGSAVNHGGNARTLTSPNVYGQAQVLSAAYTKANIPPNTISYIEAHGTGTPLGDPIEINSLKRAFRQLHKKYDLSSVDNPYCGLGTVKTNIGHLEPAAGIAGVIKVLLAMKNRKLPKIINFQQLNPRIKFKGSPFYLVCETKQWKQLKTEEGEIVPRRAGISSFGVGGVNAHVVIEEAPIQVKSQKSKVKNFDLGERPCHILTLSAKCEKALQELVQKYKELLGNNSTASITDICFTANTGRDHFKHRLAILGESTIELQKRLEALLTGRETRGLVKGQAKDKSPKIAFLFTGQGSQYVDMGREFYETQPIFRKTLEQCDDILRLYLDKPLISILYPEAGRISPINETAYTQPALFAIEYALFKLWESWGIEPNVLIGHSVGEYVAATVAGVFSLEDGLKLIAHRGRLMQQLPLGGEMLSVMASAEAIAELIAPYSEKVTVAAINGPESIVISGESEAIATINETLEKQEIKTKQLAVSHAFHSHLMKPILAEFEAVASEIGYSQPTIGIISNITGARAKENIATAKYWINHVLKPVKFAQSIETLHEEGCDIFLEIGPKPILLGMGRHCLSEDVGTWLPSLRPGKSDWQQILQSLAQLYLQGVKVDWSGFDKDYPRQKVGLPTYPFQRQSYWIETKENYQQKQYLNTGKNLHPLLGEKLNCAGKQKTFTSLLGEDSPAYLSNHQVFNQTLFPTTAYLEMAVAASNNLWENASVVIEDLRIMQGLILLPGELTTVQTVLNPSDNKSYQLQIFSQRKQHNQEELEWVLHATALIKQDEISHTPTKINLETYLLECSKSIDVKLHYQQYSQVGIDYGSSFQGIEKLWSGSNQALAQIKLPEKLMGQIIDYQFHPALLDAALQVIIHALPETDSNKTYLPVGVKEFQIYGKPGINLWAYVSLTEPSVGNKQSLKTSVTLLNQQGGIIATIKGLEVKLATKEILLESKAESITDWLYEVEWRSKGLLGKLAAPDFLEKPLKIKQKLSNELKELVNQIDDNKTSVLLSSLEELSVGYIVQGLLSMGWSYKLGETFDHDVVAQRLEVVPAQRRLFKRLLQILCEVGILESQQQQFQVRKTLEEVNPIEKNQDLLRQVPDEAATLALLDRCGNQLSGVLRGAVDPVQLVFPQGDLTTATQLYEDSSVAKVMNTIVQKAITQATEKLPSHRGIRLLEIGAGTGGTTSYILPHLNPNQAQYLFTDIGALFTNKAQEKFRDYKFLEYQSLDIEVDPSTQGFQSHQYDVVIAANVLHATTNIKQTLSNVKQLLAPGGILVLYEATTQVFWVDLVFGLLEGWWKFQDYQLRPDYPLLSRSKWKEALEEIGFTQVVTLSEVEGMSEILSQQAVIVASAPQIIESTISKSKGWLLLADEKGVAQQLAHQLNSQGDVCTLVFRGDKYEQISPTEFIINPNNPSEYEQLIDKLVAESSSLYGVVQCWSMEAGVDRIINSEELAELSFLGCGTTLSLVQALVKGEFTQPPRLWLVTCGSQPVASAQGVIPGVAQSSLWGMGKVISLEHPELKCVRIDSDPHQATEVQGKELFNEIWAEDKEDQVVWRSDSRYVPRLVPSHLKQTAEQQLIQSQPFKLGISQKGNLDSLTFEPVNRRSPGPGEVEIQVNATGLNFRDVLIALDTYPGETIMGGECAGEIVAVGTGVTRLNVGEPVIAIAPDSFSKYVTIDSHCVTLKPENLSFEQAASIPVNFLTAYYALHHVAKITAEDKILIHAAAGGTGMAAVQIAQAAGAEVFVTASPPKWKALRKRGVKYIMNSRTLEFADQVMSLTQGKGVDIVLNSLTSGEFISKSLSVLSPQGRFVEISKRGVWDSRQLAEVRSDLSYFVVDMLQTAQNQPELINSMLYELRYQFCNGLLQPPPLKIFPMEEVISAFRYMQQAKHIGKIVINQATQQNDADTAKHLSFGSDVTYLITGGTGGLGLLVAEWMVSKGAKNLVLLGRSLPNETAKQKLTELEMARVKVVIEKADVSDITDVTRVLRNIEDSKIPLAGIIHAAGILSDRVLTNQNWSNFDKVMAPKVQGAWHLHQLTQNQSLEFFVLFSSAASLLGSPGQGNHSAANAFLDGLAHYRQSIGLEGLSINWGPWEKAGKAASLSSQHQNQMLIKGISPISTEGGLQILAELLAQDLTQVGVLNINWSQLFKQLPIGSKTTFLEEFSLAKTTFTANNYGLLEQLETSFLREREKLLTTYIQSKVAQELGITASKIDMQQSLNTMGLDSLMAVKLRNCFQTDLGVDVSIVKFIEKVSIVDLTTEVNGQLTQIDRNQRIEQNEDRQTLVADLKDSNWVKLKL